MGALGEPLEPQVPFGSRQLAARQGRDPSGADVEVFQRLYQACNDLLQAPLGPPLPVDGVFGAAAADAARRLQQRFGLAADGLVGPSTCFVLGHGVGAHTTYGGPAFGSRPLRAGDCGGDVYVLQNRLAVAGLLPRAADGTCGEGTLRALAEFKAEAGLPDTPGADAATANALIVRSLAGGRAVWSGRNGLDVAWVQRRLRESGCYAGSLDGVCGPDTAGAVRAFQARSGLVVDGVVGPATFFALGGGGKRQAEPRGGRRRAASGIPRPAWREPRAQGV